jgi:molybdopterin converting factor small subunit
VTVEVRLFATLAQFLPPGSKNGLGRLDVPDGTTLGDLPARLGIPPALERVCLLNGAEAGPERRLAPGDVIDMFPPLAGGGYGPSRSARRITESISAPIKSARLER